jgi:SAM-dependent methyltransferase
MMDPDFSEDPDYRHWSDEFQFALDRIGPQDRVLDVGCGYGYFVERAGERTDTSGIEANAHSQRRAAARGLDVRHGTAEAFADELAGAFDVVCAFQTLEHIYGAGRFLKALRRMLKPGGRLMVSVPNNEPYIERFNKYATSNTPPHHVGLWDRPSLQAAGRHFELEPFEHAYLDVAKRPLVSAYLRAASWMGVWSEVHHHRAMELAKILIAMPFAIPFALAELAITGRTKAENIAMVFRKPV